MKRRPTNPAESTAANPHRSRDGVVRARHRCNEDPWLNPSDAAVRTLMGV